MVDLNFAAMAARAITRATVGSALAKKQDRARNLGLIEEVLELRPRNYQPVSVGDIKQVGRRHDLPPLTLAVLKEKESGPLGAYTKAGRIVIMDEPHIFSAESGHAHDVDAPHLSYPKWIPKAQTRRLPPKFLETWGKHPYDLSQDERWQLWSWQAECNFDAALSALSVGSTQVLLKHWGRMGFASPLDMLKFAYEGEANHLDLTVRWFVMEGKIDALRESNWREIALYNGTGDVEAYRLGCQAIAKKRAGLYQA